MCTCERTVRTMWNKVHFVVIYERRRLEQEFQLWGLPSVRMVQRFSLRRQYSKVSWSTSAIPPVSSRLHTASHWVQVLLSPFWIFSPLFVHLSLCSFFCRHFLSIWWFFSWTVNVQKIIVSFRNLGYPAADNSGKKLCPYVSTSFAVEGEFPFPQGWFDPYCISVVCFFALYLGSC